MKAQLVELMKMLTDGEPFPVHTAKLDVISVIISL